MMLIFGLTPEEYNFIFTEVVHPLKKRGGKVGCFGSRARGDYHKFSDLDLMVEIDRDISKELGEIRENLSNSNFPFKVDIVLLSEFADSFKPGFEKDRKIFES